MTNNTNNSAKIQAALDKRNKRKQIPATTHTTDFDDPTTFSKRIKPIQLFLVIYILKRFSKDKEHSLSVSEIDVLMDRIVGPYMKDYSKTEDSDARQKTLKNILNHLCESEDYFIDNKEYYLEGNSEKLASESSENALPPIALILNTVLGGRVRMYQPGKSKHYYYFEANTSESDLSLISGSILSSHFFSDYEKDYLLSRIHTLNLYKSKEKLLKKFYGNEDVAPIIKGLRVAALPRLIYPNKLVHKPDGSKKKQSISKSKELFSLPQDSSDILSNIQILYRGIQEKYQVKILYGKYSTNKEDARQNKVTFEKKSEAYIINPFSMLWNGGHYYLVATKANPDGSQSSVRHLRIDRIIDASLLVQEEDHTKYVTRADFPPELQGFTCKSIRGREKLDIQKYTASFPKMLSNFKNENFETIILECTSSTLSIIVDTFGADNIQVKPSTLPHKKEKMGDTTEYIFVRIKNVMYTNALFFCLQNQTNVTSSIPNVVAVSPKRLVLDVQNHLKQSHNYYDEVLKLAANAKDPFLFKDYLLFDE